jgi:hypothetical protein
VSEVVGSLSMLAITMALLGGASALALLSVHGAASLLTKNGAIEGQKAGVLVTVVGSQSNSTGAYVWLYDYGWVSTQVQGAFLNGETTTWSSSCQAQWAHSLCVLVLPPSSKGQVTVVVGGVSIVASV